MRPNLLAIAASLFLMAPAWTQTTLPVGSNPPALEFDHFPSRLHTFVWRNWNLLPVTRLAGVVDTSPEKIRALADSMGLPAEEPIPDFYRSRLYLTVIRRNWHILPYDQLLKLLDMTAEQLAYVLREDDFFYIKLGSLKPKCDPLKWTDPDQPARDRCAAIKALVQKQFAPDPSIAVEPPLAFLNELAGNIPDSAIKPRPLDLDHPRYLYSYFAVFGDPLVDPSLDPFPDKLLSQLADLGVNGVWLHVVLRDLAPSADFPEFGHGWEKRLDNLATLVARAKRFGIGIYLYQNEPRAMPESFFKLEGRQEMAGVKEGDHLAMCTSHPTVRKWLTGSLAHVFTRVPDLAGVFTITASENLTNCVSHGQHKKCPHCKDRKPADIIAQANTAIEEGVHRGSPKARVICWDWGWKDDYAADIIAGLPKNVMLQSVSEWSLPIERGGIKSAVGEYSISSVGPGPRASRHWALARARGIPVAAKVQANNTWELSAVPFLPAMELVARHASNLSRADVDGVMLSWSLGGYPSPNLRIFERLLKKDAPSVDAVLDEIAADRYGPQGAPHARRAWKLFSDAFEQFPYNITVVYTGPHQSGPANLFFAKKTGFNATMVGIPYDDLKRWRGPYPEEVFAAQMEKVGTGFVSAAAQLEQAVNQAPAEKRDRARHDLLIARAAAVHFSSAANQIQFVMLRDELASKKDLAAEKTAANRSRMRRLLEAESSLARQLYRLQRQDSRIGFEASNHYYYLPQDLIEKTINCEHLAAQLK